LCSVHTEFSVCVLCTQSSVFQIYKIRLGLKCTFLHYIHTYTHTYIHTYIHTHVYIHTYIRTYINTHIHTYIHTYTIHTYTLTYIHGTPIVKLMYRMDTRCTNNQAEAFAILKALEYVQTNQENDEDKIATVHTDSRTTLYSLYNTDK